MKLIFLGAPGAGKGTFTNILSKKLGIPTISTGDIFREEVRKETELSKKLKEIMGKGAFVSDEITIEVIKKRLKKSDCKNGFILDGFPRTIPQAEVLDKITKIDMVIDLVVDEEYIIKRLLARRGCPKCNRNYNLITSSKPKNEGLCDDCNVKLEQRKDDNEQIIKHRQETYKNQTAPLIDFYKRKGILKDVDAMGEIDAVIDRMMKIL